MCDTEISQVEMEAAPVGTEVLDWEGDALIKEGPDAWFYKHQPMRGNVPRPFSSEVVARAYGPARLFREVKA